MVRRALISRNIGKHEEHRKGLFWSFACLLFALASLYVYFVNTAALHGVKWQETAKKTNGVRMSTSELEGTYLAKKRNITLALAAELGFEEPRNVMFVSKHQSAVSLR